MMCIVDIWYVVLVLATLISFHVTRVTVLCWHTHCHIVIQYIC